MQTVTLSSPQDVAMDVKHVNDLWRVEWKSKKLRATLWLFCLLPYDDRRSLRFGEKNQHSAPAWETFN